MEDVLIVTFDFCHPDIPAMAITREKSDKTIEVVNWFAGDKAMDLYNRLVEKQKHILRG